MTADDELVASVAGESAEVLVEEVGCSTCNHRSTFRLFFEGPTVWGLCVFCDTRFDLNKVVFAREAMFVPPSPPKPEKRGWFGRKVKPVAAPVKKGSGVKSPA